MNSKGKGGILHPEVRILGSPEEVAREAAKVFVPRMDEAVRGEGEADVLPAMLIRPMEGKCLWLAHRSAARLLKTI